MRFAVAVIAVLVMAILWPAVLTMGQPDEEPPEITGVQVFLIGETWFQVTWETDEPALGGVEWGLDRDLGTVQFEEGGDLTTSHHLNVTGLRRGTEHFAVIFATDSSNNTGYSEVLQIGTFPIGEEERFWSVWGLPIGLIAIMLALIALVVAWNRLRPGRVD